MWKMNEDSQFQINTETLKTLPGSLPTIMSREDPILAILNIIDLKYKYNLYAFLKIQ